MVKSHMSKVRKARRIQRRVRRVGATDREGTYAHTTLLNLARAGFAGRVIGVHPTRSVAAARSVA